MGVALPREWDDTGEVRAVRGSALKLVEKVKRARGGTDGR
jgi:hypothetical protein